MARFILIIAFLAILANIVEATCYPRKTCLLIAHDPTLCQFKS